MADSFQSIHFNVAGEDEDTVRAAGARPLSLRAGPTIAAGTPSVFANDEAAARHYLSRVLAGDTRSGMRGLTAPNDPQVVPDLELRDSKRSPLTNTSIVRFVQTQSAIPVFGSRAIVEMDSRRELLTIDAELAHVEGVAPIAAISAAKALESIAAKANVEVATLGQVKAPKLYFYHDEEKDRWHLVHYFQNVPAAPRDYAAGLKSHGSHPSIAQNQPQLDYLVDAHDGAVLLYWSTAPMLTKCGGDDDDGIPRAFFGGLDEAGKFVLWDSLLRIKTVDLGGQDIESSNLPTDPISSPTATFANCGAAVSAHFNAMRVSEFLRQVLRRDGIDDNGMELISYVNCTSKYQTPPEWHNAAWWKQRMWYGQARDGNGMLKSFARHLDIIAHELAHGITEYTSNLAYLRQSGALNESFSDIFGVIIANWDRSQPDTGGDVSSWRWEIGPSLGHGGLPLRDMKDPRRTSSPDHMNDYDNTPADNGGVHTNSNIHNKAAYNFLTARDANGPIFTPADVAILYYLTLMRLDKLATFSQTLKTLLNVAGTYFAGDPRRQQKLDAISAAYAVVGIT